MPALPSAPVRRPLAISTGIAVTLLIGLSLAACGPEAKADTTAPTAQQASTTTSVTRSNSTTTESQAASTTVTSASTGTSAGTFFDSSQVHEISVAFSEEDYDAMIQTYKDSGGKDWIKATITIDGVTLKEVGMRLKGNSSIMGLRNGGGQGGRGPGGNVSSSAPQTLPWLIRLDKYVDGQN